MKCCSDCKTIKPLMDFHKDKSKSDGRVGACKSCKIERSRIYRLNNPDRIQANSRTYYEANRENILDYQKKYALENPEKITAYKRQYRDSEMGVWTKLNAAASQRAKKKNRLYELSPEILYALAASQGNKCAVTHIPFDLTREGTTFRRPFAPSIDRIDNCEGYTLKNTQIVCVIVNYAKNEFSMMDFDAMCHARQEVLNK